MSSNEKFQPGEEMFEDVEGHAYKSGRALPAEDDTEGHALRSGRALPAEDDVEGHATRVRVLRSDEPAEDDDTEGQVASRKS